MRNTEVDERQIPDRDSGCSRSTTVNGVSLSVAQMLMRNSDIRLTMNTYTYLELTDTAGAVAALPVV